MPTFGASSQGASNSSAGANYVQVFPYAATEEGAVTKLSMWMIGNGANQAFRPVIYANSAGVPGALLATGPEVVVSGSTPASTLIDFPLTTPLDVVAATYHLGWHSGTTNEGTNFYWNNVGAGRRYKSDTYSDGSPDPFGSPDGTDVVKCTIYATYTVGPDPVVLGHTQGGRW